MEEEFSSYVRKNEIKKNLNIKMALKEIGRIFKNNIMQ